jgi:nitric oxide reductase subunit C
VSRVELTERTPRRAGVKQLVFGCLTVGFVLQSAYVYTAGTELAAPAAASAEAREGFNLFQQYNCVACHQLYGLGGYMGPDLTNVASHSEKGLAYARIFLENGTDKMPDFGLREDEIENLLSFLEYAAQSGTYPLQDPEIAWYGTVSF